MSLPYTVISSASFLQSVTIEILGVKALDRMMAAWDAASDAVSVKEARSAYDCQRARNRICARPFF